MKRAQRLRSIQVKIVYFYYFLCSQAKAAVYYQTFHLNMSEKELLGLFLLCITLKTTAWLQSFLVGAFCAKTNKLKFQNYVKNKDYFCVLCDIRKISLNQHIFKGF